jgi:hypothetical protein
MAEYNGHVSACPPVFLSPQPEKERRGKRRRPNTPFGMQSERSVIDWSQTPTSSFLERANKRYQESAAKLGDRDGGDGQDVVTANTLKLFSQNPSATNLLQ